MVIKYAYLIEDTETCFTSLLFSDVEFNLRFCLNQSISLKYIVIVFGGNVATYVTVRTWTIGLLNPLMYSTWI